MSWPRCPPKVLTALGEPFPGEAEAGSVMEPSVHDNCVCSSDVQCVHVFPYLPANASRRYSSFTRYEAHRRRQEHLRPNEAPAWVDVPAISALRDEAVT